MSSSECASQSASNSSTEVDGMKNECLEKTWREQTRVFGRTVMISKKFVLLGSTLKQRGAMLFNKILVNIYWNLDVITKNAVLFKNLTLFFLFFFNEYTSFWEFMWDGLWNN